LNPNLCRIVLRPRHPLEVLDLACVLVRHKWRPYARLSFWVLLPVWIVASAVAFFLPDAGVAVLLVLLCLGPLLEAPFTRMTGLLLFQDTVGVWEVVRDTIGRTGAMILPFAIRATVGWIPLVDAALLFVTEATLLERVPAPRALQRSTLLAGGNGAQAWAGALAWYGMTGWCAVVGELAGQGIVRDILQLGEPFGSAWDLRVTPYVLAGLIAARPLFAIDRLLLYVDARTRAEGWDLQVGLRAAGLT
jgi:hypothetical protein